ncbi:DUF6391 domain-containing protein [Spirulina sp. CS-785/01]|uniref:DUF6391 domain-containing protein n=1 Tax=Spirulina sp. CS-785/01 TaxID=3021716 RepID=UPI00232E9C63|nr:DUF6391 domain-containing protein [Spirulina sp. CS-785/01]MDB9315216.1 DUF6391 domain-containing protein [Spirulina sp. CS-785/01]
MSNTANPDFGAFFSPTPTQDTDLLQQLPFLPGLQELLLLRQVHGLEHATVWILDEMSKTQNRPTDSDLLGGLSTEQGFYLYGEVNPLHLQKAVPEALQRLQNGEWNLALHPRCGTNMSVALLLTTGLALGTSFLLPRTPFEQLLGIGLAGFMANQLAPDMGNLTQRFITTAIPYNVAIQKISRTTDFWGRPASFIQVSWHEG